MRVAKPTYTRNGTQRRSSRWHVHVKIRGRWERLPAYTDKSASEMLGRRIERLAGRKSSVTELDDEMLNWIDNLDPEHRAKLMSWGLLDESARAITDPLTDHVDDYARHLRNKGDTDSHAGQQQHRIMTVLDGIGVAYWVKLTSGRVEAWLASQRADKKRLFSDRTSNAHLGAIKSFCTWMRDDGRVGTTPLRRLKAVPVTDEKERGAFTIEQVQQLLDSTARSEKVRRTLDGPSRVLLYRLALETGLRAGAIASLTRDSFKFADNGSALVTVQAGQQKNRRAHRVPVRKCLAADIRLRIARTPAGRSLFRLCRGQGAAILRADLRDAGLPEYDAEGHALVFHSLRHTAATWLCACGVDLKIVQAVLGHRTFALTADRYTHAQLERVAAEMAKMPELKATGTDDACPVLDMGLSSDGVECPPMAERAGDGAIKTAVSPLETRVSSAFESSASANSATPAPVRAS